MPHLPDFIEMLSAGLCCSCVCRAPNIWMTTPKLLPSCFKKKPTELSWVSLGRHRCPHLLPSVGTSRPQVKSGPPLACRHMVLWGHQTECPPPSGPITLTGELPRKKSLERECCPRDLRSPSTEPQGFLEKGQAWGSTGHLLMPLPATHVFSITQSVIRLFRKSPATELN